MDWPDIKGHDDNIHILKTMLATGRMPHALLFTGPKGIGKRTLAKITAKAILCSGDGTKPCGGCESCKLMAREAHPDLLIVNPEGSSIKIEQIRMLQQEAGKAPHMNESRVCIIEDAERMTVQAQNSLLKLLEEPPLGFVFILTAAAVRSLLVTILSRCRMVRFNPLKYDVLIQLLTSQGVPIKTAEVAARLGGGRMGDALKLTMENEVSLRDRAFEIVCALPQNRNLLWENAALLEKLGGSEVKKLLTYLLYIFRDLYLLEYQEQQLVLNIDLIEQLSIQVDYWQEKGIIGAMDDIKEAESALNANANVRLTVEALLIHLMNWAQRRKSFADCSWGAF